MKIPKRINLKTALIFVVIGILITSGLFYVFAVTPSSPMYIGSGVYPGAPGYTVWREGSNYFAKDAKGQIASGFSGTNFSDIINNCIDALPVGGAAETSGGTIELAEGIFEIDSSILIDQFHVTIQGQGRLSSEIRITADFDGIVVSKSMATIRDLRIGMTGSVNPYNSAALNFKPPTSDDISYCLVENIVFRRSYFAKGSESGYGIYLYTTVMNGDLYFNTFNHIYFDGSWKCCMNLTAEASGSSINGNHFGDIKAYHSYCNLHTNPIDGVVNSNWFKDFAFSDYYATSSLLIGGTANILFNIRSWDLPSGAVLTILASGWKTQILGGVLPSIVDNGSETYRLESVGTVFPTNPSEGQQFYHVTNNLLYFYNGTQWVDVTIGAQGPAGPAGTLEGQQPYDYLVFINATSTYMINGTTGDIDFSGSPSATINNALGNATGTVLLCSGIYTLTGDTGLTMDTNDITLRGMGDGTSLECEAGFDDHIIHVTADYVTICDLRIDGTNQAASYHGILEDGNGNGGLFVHHVRIRDCGGDGIRLGDTDASWEGNWAKIHHVVIKDNGVYGIHFTYDATDSELVDFLISGHDGVGDAGINVGCDNIRITTGHLWGNQYEMKIAEDDYSGKGSVNGLIVSNVGFMDGGEQGEHRIYHAGSKNFINSVFLGCEIWVAKLSGTDTYDGFYLAGDTWCVSITGCVFRGDNEADTKQGRYGIFMDASVHNCTIVSNTFEGFCQADPIQTTGALNLQEGYNVVYNCG